MPPGWLTVTSNSTNPKQKFFSSCLPILQNPTSPGFLPHWGPYQPPGSCCKLKDVLRTEGCAGDELPSFSSPSFLFLADHDIFLIHFVFFQDIVELIIYDIFWGYNHNQLYLLKVMVKLPWSDFDIPETLPLHILMGSLVIFFICVHGWTHSFILILANSIFLMTGVTLVWGIFCLILRLDPHL